MIIKWKEDYKTGIPMVDEQHKKLFEIANRAYEILGDQFTLDKYDDIVVILEELKEYAIYHFGCEEKYMESINYEGLPTQKKQHSKFIDKIQSVDLFAVDEEQEKFLLEILDFIVNWIGNHILKVDKRISE